MKNPYAKPVAKRPRSEENSAAAATETTSTNASVLNRRSFGDGGLDWDEAFNCLEQQQQQQQRSSQSANGDRSTADVAVERLNASLTGEKPQPTVGRTNHSAVEQVHVKPIPSVPPSSPCSGKVVNPYLKSTTVKPLLINLSEEKSKGATTAPSSSVATKTVPASSQNPSSPSTSLRHKHASPSLDPQALSSINTTTSVLLPAKPVDIAASVSVKPIASSSLSTSAGASVDGRPEKTTLLPKPAAWDSSSSASSVPLLSLNQTVNSSSPSRKQEAASMVHSKCSSRGHSNVSLPRPPTWNSNKSSTASNSSSCSFAGGSRPSSSHGQPSTTTMQPNNIDIGLPPPLNFSPELVKPPNDEYRSLLVKNANLSDPLLNGWTLFSHQKKAILRSLIMRRFILALDMGLGKTLIGCVWAKAFQQTFDNLKILIVCPVSLKSEWKRTAEEATGLQVDDDSESTSVQIHSWGKVPTEVSSNLSNFVVVFDEAHSMQSLQALRTKNALSLVRPQRCVGVLLLSGTPMKNGKPLNLFPLLKAVKHPFGNHQKAYETHFCAGRQTSFNGRIQWDANGSSNLVQLRDRVASHLLYMTKEECLDDLPPLTREFRQVPISSRHQIQHDLALNDLAKVYNTTGSLENSGDLVLTAMQRVRQIGSFAKIDASVALAKDVLQEQSAVVIFTSFVAVAKDVHKRLADAGWEGELLTGETVGKKRQSMVDNFQAGLSPVFVLTFGAGGVGLTLTAAHTIILLDRPWTASEAQQAEDRVRRIGQTKPVRSIWMVAFDLDKQIDSLLEQKKQTSSVVLKEGKVGLTSASAPKISVFALLRKLLGSGCLSTSSVSVRHPAIDGESTRT